MWRTTSASTGLAALTGFVKGITPAVRWSHYQMADAGVALARTSNVDVIIGLGGGSAIDAAKLIGTAATAVPVAAPAKGKSTVPVIAVDSTIVSEFAGKVAAKGVTK